MIYSIAVEYGSMFSRILASFGSIAFYGIPFHTDAMRMKALRVILE
jgi:hypothetical protein